MPGSFTFTFAHAEGVIRTALGIPARQGAVAA